MKVTTDACLFGAWVAKEIENTKAEPKRILDIGAGTGLLSLMLAQVADQSAIDAVEINTDAYQEASENFDKSPWNDRLTCYSSSIQDFKTKEQYGWIICNPPFFSKNQKGHKQNKNQAIHDDSLSLGDLIRKVNELLKDDGTLFMLLPEFEMNKFSNQAKQVGLNPIKEVAVRNTSEQPIFRMMNTYQRAQREQVHSQIIIRKENGKYTDRFWDLLSPYYLEYNNPNTR